MTKEEANLETTTKPKEKVPVTKRPTKKKPKDKPKRPLSAYNFFFKEEREKILKVVQADDPEKVPENDPKSDDYLNEEAIARLRKEGGKVSFEEMGKLIGQRWKNIDPDRLGKYAELASEDTERYKKEMASYNGRQEAKMRSEALKPPTTFPGGRGDGGKGGTGAPGYPEGMSGMQSAFASAAGMGGGYPYGMDFSSYGMGMGGMYGPYGGYGGMGAAQMGGGNPEAMAQQMSQQMSSGGGGMEGGSGGQYGGRGGGAGGMYGMMGQMGSAGGFQGGMMGYGGGGQSGGDYGQQQQQQGMDPSAQGGMYGGYGGGQVWGQQ